MEKGKHHQQLLLAAVAAILIAAVASFAFAASPPVTVTMAVTGDPVPGATITAKATVTVNDGSTLQSITWSQVGGVGATLTNTTTDTVTVSLPARKVFREQLPPLVFMRERRRERRLRLLRPEGGNDGGRQIVHASNESGKVPNLFLGVGGAV